MSQDTTLVSEIPVSEITPDDVRVAERPARHRPKGAKRREAGLSRSARLGIGFASIVVVLVAWQLCSDWGVVDKLFASSPSKVATSGYDHIKDGSLLRALGQSGKLFLISFVLASVIGIAAGVLIGWFGIVRAAAEPWVNTLNATPRIALIPLIILWLGVGFNGRAFFVFLIAVFPIVINVSTGIAATDRQLVSVARSFLGSDIDILRTVAIPGSIPHLVSGLRQGLAQALIGVVIAEYLMGADGIGGMILNAGANLDSATVYVGIIAVALVALLINAGFRRLERRVDHWRGAER